MIATQSPELDEILQGFPGVKQVDAIEDAEFIRFTIQLRIDPADHPNPPQIFVLFRQSEFMQARTVPAMLGLGAQEQDRTNFLQGRLQRQRDSDESPPGSQRHLGRAHG